MGSRMQECPKCDNRVRTLYDWKGIGSVFYAAAAFVRTESQGVLERTHLTDADAGAVAATVDPADAFPEHVVQTEGDKLRVVVPVLGQMRVHETLWWGA